MNKNEFEVKDISPFNEFFFIDCIYNSIFSLLNYMEINTLSILLNSYFHYERANDNVLGFTIQAKSIDPLENVLKKRSVTMERYENYQNFLEVSKESIRNGIPVITQVDCYYEEIRKDTYLKEHLDHSLLVYGLNQSDFFVFEQSNKRVLNFKSKAMSHENLLKAMLGYTERYLPNSEHACSYFRLVKEESVKPYVTPEINIIKDYLHDLAFFSGNEILYESMRNLKKLVEQNEINSSNINDVVDTVNKIVNNKAIQKRIFSEISIRPFQYIEQSVKGWNYLVFLLTKSVYFPEKNNSSQKSDLLQTIDHVIEYEEILNEQYVTYDNEYK